MVGRPTRVGRTFKNGIERCNLKNSKPGKRLEATAAIRGRAESRGLAGQHFL